MCVCELEHILLKIGMVDLTKNYRTVPIFSRIDP
jgi:hypothetical protein